MPERTAALQVKRFCGSVEFTVSQVDVYVTEPQGEGDELLLNLELHCGQPSKCGCPCRA